MSMQAVVADAVLTARGVIGDAIVVEGGRVREVTTHHRLGDMATVEHPGSTLVPAFIDSHIHPIGYAALVTGTSLKDADGIDGLVDINEPTSADELNRIPREEIGTSIPDFGFPHDYIQYRTGQRIGSGGVQRTLWEWVA